MARAQQPDAKSGWILDPVDPTTSEYPAGWLLVFVVNDSGTLVSRELAFGGVYVWIHRTTGEALYVGRSTCVRKRLREHLWPHGRDLVTWHGLRPDGLAAVRVLRCDDSARRQQLEAQLIRRLQPPYNVVVPWGDA